MEEEARHAVPSSSDSEKELLRYQEKSPCGKYKCFNEDLYKKRNQFRLYQGYRQEKE